MNPGHSEAAATFLNDSERAAWHDQALWFVRQRRDRAALFVPVDASLHLHQPVDRQVRGPLLALVLPRELGLGLPRGK